MHPVVAEELALLARVRAAAAAAAAVLPVTPYFGHLGLVTDGRAWDLLLGSTPLVDSTRRVSLVEWHRSRLADVFFDGREGAPYRLRPPGPPGGGQVVARRALHFAAGELIRIDAAGA